MKRDWTFYDTLRYYIKQGWLKKDLKHSELKWEAGKTHTVCINSYPYQYMVTIKRRRYSEPFLEQDDG